MYFEAIVGNPPYHLKDGCGGTNDKPLYQLFSILANNLCTEYTSIIIPSRWYSAGKESFFGVFRKHMLTCGKISKLISYLNSNSVFYNIGIKGGVCYYLYDNKHYGLCDYTFITDKSVEQSFINLSKFDVLIRYPYLQNIVYKIVEITKTNNSKFIDNLISKDTPFGIGSNPKTNKKHSIRIYSEKNSEHDVLLFYIEKLKRKIEYVSLKDIKKNKKDIDKIKVLITQSGGSGMNTDSILGKPEIAPKHSVCSQTYLYTTFETEIEAKNFYKYLHTKFLRVLVYSIKITQHAPQKVYRFVPVQDFTDKSDIDWSKTISEIDQQLYNKYKLNKDEINYIENLIKTITISQ